MPRLYYTMANVFSTFSVFLSPEWPNFSSIFRYFNYLRIQTSINFFCSLECPTSSLSNNDLCINRSDFDKLFLLHFASNSWKFSTYESVWTWSSYSILEHVLLLNGCGFFGDGLTAILVSLTHTLWYIRMSSKCKSLIVFHTAMADPLILSGIKSILLAWASSSLLTSVCVNRVASLVLGAANSSSFVSVTLVFSLVCRSGVKTSSFKSWQI